MMLDMLTTDTAAKHGHDYTYSPPRTIASCAGKGYNYSLAQMPLSLFGAVMGKQTASPAPSTPPADEDADVNDSNSKSSTDFSNGFMTTTSDLHGLPASPAPSRPASLSSCEAIEGRKKRAPRPKTTYHLAHPPTAGPRQKLHIRPKTLLQLHQVVPSRHPKPAYEVIPYSLLAPRSTRRLAGTFAIKDRLGPHDMLIVKAEAYGQKDDEEKTDDERWGTREVVGIICPPKKGEKDGSEKTELLLDDGSRWEVTQLPNGAYEFNFTDSHGLQCKRRWVPKLPHNRRLSALSTAAQSGQSPSIAADDKKFNFSTIALNSRRHPIIASMTRTNIDVLDAYNVPSATSPPTPSLPPTAVATPVEGPITLPDAASFLDNIAERLPLKTDDALRRFIVVSGIWVAFSENWSPGYVWSRNACPLPLTATPVSRPPPSRTVSMSFAESPRSVSTNSLADDNRRSIPKIFRTGTQTVQRNASLGNRPPAPKSAATSPAASPMAKTRSRRANSTGTADLFSRSGSTRKRLGFALGDQILLETEEERELKRSMELLRIKELSLPDTPLTAAPITTPTPIPIQIIEPPPAEDDSPLPTPPSPSSRALKTQSAYNPVTTTGLWDSGVTAGTGLKTRPTSLVVLNEKKEKAKRKQEKSRVKTEEKSKGKKGERLRDRFLGIFRREKN
jgi:hypothetical protein